MKTIKVYDTAYFRLKQMAEQYSDGHPVDDYDIAEAVEAIMETFVYGGDKE